MRTTARRGSGVDGALAQLASMIGPHIKESTVSRSDLEIALDSLGGGPSLRAEAMKALAVARITVVGEPDPVLAASDGTAAPDAPDDDSGPKPLHAAGSDPLAAARRRIRLDQHHSARRRSNILLTAAEEVGLALLYRSDGAMLGQGEFADLEGEARDAAEAMVLHNIRLVHSVAQKYVGQGLEYDDLVQHATRGLLRAVERFDPQAGFKFSTYATWWLRQAVTRALADEGRIIRIPVHMWEVVRRVMRTREQLTREGRAPRLRELAAECGLGVEKVVECLRLAPGVVSLETPLGEDGFTLGDLVAAQADVPEHVEVHGLFPEDVERLLGVLDERSADVIRRRFSLAPYDSSSTLDEIGHVYGVTRERIRQIESKAMNQLRDRLVHEGHQLHVASGKRTRASGGPVATQPEEARASATA